MLKTSFHINKTLMYVQAFYLRVCYQKISLNFKRVFYAINKIKEKYFNKLNT